MKAHLSGDKNWYVVRTNIKCEEKAARNLRLAGYEHYLPVMRYEVKHQRTNTRIVKEKPLMLRYLFVAQPKGNADWFTLRACEGVECVLGVQGQPIPVPFKAVEKIFLAETDMVFDDTKEARIHRREEARTKKATAAMKYRPGADVWVTDERNPFATFGGIVEEVTSSGKVRVLMDIFGRLTPADFDVDQISTAA